MRRMSKNELDAMDNFAFAAEILRDKKAILASKGKYYTPMYRKLETAIAALEAQSAKVMCQVVITTEEIEALFKQYNRRYETVANGIYALYDNNTSNDRVTVELSRDSGCRAISYAGRIIGGLDELERRM